MQSSEYIGTYLRLQPQKFFRFGCIEVVFFCPSISKAGVITLNWSNRPDNDVLITPEGNILCCRNTIQGAANNTKAAISGRKAEH